MPQPTNLNADLYPKNVDAKAEIKEGLARAIREHKRVLLIFGANWCFDCRVLEFALHHSDAAPLAERGFIVVHVDIGEGNLNPDLVARYGIPAKHGVPALAVLDSDGKLLYSDTASGIPKRALDGSGGSNYISKPVGTKSVSRRFAETEKHPRTNFFASSKAWKFAAGPNGTSALAPLALGPL